MCRKAVNQSINQSKLIAAAEIVKMPLQPIVTAAQSNR